ncbi:uncharacterized protein LOC122873163 isoform X1 [Siniperca chuatsi]|uniref:uncharacterized protein LOC122873163 isoform X1 n=1 Tax=Siniperca chuatsi TaxID=119488 RepID=UPI001CE1E4E2|nr:uncharacterized protein LOC122873163 isoform X1 [Siniperca chuatsi]
MGGARENSHTYQHADCTFKPGEPRAICPTPIKVVEGDDVTLQCRLDPRDDVSTFGVDWKKGYDKDVVHSYRHQQDQHNLQMDQYRNRTHLNHEDLSRGVLTLRISSVRPSDSGLYRGFVSKLIIVRFNIEVIVVGKDQQNETERDDSSTTGPPEEEVTEPDDRDAAKMEAGWKIVLPVVVPVVAAAALVGGVIFILVKRGKIQICKKKLRGVMEPNNFEMQNLRTKAAEAGEDPDGAAENGLGAAGIAQEQTDARVLVGHEDPEG